MSVVEKVWAWPNLYHKIVKSHRYCLHQVSLKLVWRGLVESSLSSNFSCISSPTIRQLFLIPIQHSTRGLISGDGKRGLQTGETGITEVGMHILESNILNSSLENGVIAREKNTDFRGFLMKLSSQVSLW